MQRGISALSYGRACSRKNRSKVTTPATPDEFNAAHLRSSHRIKRSIPPGVASADWFAEGWNALGSTRSLVLADAFEPARKWNVSLNLQFQCSTSLDIAQLFPQMVSQSHQTMADLRRLGLEAIFCCLSQCPFLHNLLSLDLMMRKVIRCLNLRRKNSCCERDQH